MKRVGFHKEVKNGCDDIKTHPTDSKPRRYSGFVSWRTVGVRRVVAQSATADCDK
jgi:hypothetical protein